MTNLFYNWPHRNFAKKKFRKGHFDLLHQLVLPKAVSLIISSLY